jgi:hypothetical protein
VKYQADQRFFFRSQEGKENGFFNFNHHHRDRHYRQRRRRQRLYARKQSIFQFSFLQK